MFDNDYGSNNQKDFEKFKCLKSDRYFVNNTKKDLLLSVLLVVVYFSQFFINVFSGNVRIYAVTSLGKLNALASKVAPALLALS